MTESNDEPKKKRGRRKGTPKTGGRQKGVPNRNSLSVLGALDKASIPIIEFLVADIQMLEPAARVNEWHRLLAFCYPKLKEIEFNPSLPPPAAGASQAPDSLPAPAGPTSREERLRVIRGQVSGKPEAPG